jgi:hypothetical protein
MAELEAAALTLGYTRIHLTTGPRQPEARDLYLAAGYTPRFDVTADPETIGPLAFAKELVAGAGLAQWRQPTWAEIEEQRRRRAEPGEADGADPDPTVGRQPRPECGGEPTGDAGPLLRRIAHQQSDLDIDERRHEHAKSVNGSHR